MTVDTHRLERTLGRLTHGMVLRREGAERRRARVRLGERYMEFQVPISGESGSIVAFITVAVEFDAPYHPAYGQRDSELTKPMFSFGAELTTAAPVMLTGVVMGWAEDERGAILGAEVAIGVCSPGADAAVAFDGVAHLTFEGYGAPHDEDGDT